ncbi:hypothetical protein PVIIG_05760 [Plasmodium vivax India VII]|uniref:Uncharacterized protein n=1 Tax=Plasmodium vivax India VII TaxID=1077284 RepID=A0A0J9SI72_PLAVI|nr:hypothetical protein PVIIG_05760 [Plasmodium vivax India VII]
MPDISFSTVRRDVTTNVDLGCLNVSDDIERELRDKISLLDRSNGTDDFRQKCEEINNFLDEQKDVYKVCYQHSYKQRLWYIPKIIEELLSKSTKYPKCPQRWTSEPEKATKLTVKEEKSHDKNEKPETKTKAENVSELPQNSAIPRSADATPDLGTEQKAGRPNASPAVEALPPNQSSSHDSQITEENAVKYAIIIYVNEDSLVLPNVPDNHALGDTKFCVGNFDKVEKDDTLCYGDGSVKYVTLEHEPDDENPDDYVTFKLLSKLSSHNPDNKSRPTNIPQPNNCIANSQLAASTPLPSVEPH